jgi:hypothetical protein
MRFFLDHISFLIFRKNLLLLFFSVFIFENFFIGRRASFPIEYWFYTWWGYQFDQRSWV